MFSKKVGQINYSEITNPVNIFSQKVRTLATQVHNRDSAHILNYVIMAEFRVRFQNMGAVPIKPL
jgi:hypothetical protein